MAEKIDVVQLYLKKAHQALIEAQDNLELGHYEVTISRAYYAMFYAASGLLASRGISRSKHSGVHSAFGQYFVKPGLIEPDYNRMLITAFNARLDSDYEVQSLLGQVAAQDTLADAERFVERIETFLRQEGDL